MDYSFFPARLWFKAAHLAKCSLWPLLSGLCAEDPSSMVTTTAFYSPRLVFLSLPLLLSPTSFLRVWHKSFHFDLDSYHPRRRFKVSNQSKGHLAEQELISVWVGVCLGEHRGKVGGPRDPVVIPLWLWIFWSTFASILTSLTTTLTLVTKCC